LAYQSDEAGEFEIFVPPFPAVNNGRWQGSVGGGTRAVWARDSKELFFLAPAGIFIRVGVWGGPTWVATRPAKFLEATDYLASGFAARPYDISLDGKRFLMMKPLGKSDSSKDTTLVVVQHWDDELQRLVPTRYFPAQNALAESDRTAENNNAHG